MARVMLDEDEPMTIKEFLLSKYYHDGLWELFRGELIAMSPARVGHDFTVSRISHLFQSAISSFSMNCRVAGQTTAVLYEDDSFVMPDVLVTCDKSRIDENGRFRPAPEVIVEVLSPATREYCLHEKKDLYRDAGADEYWIVDLEDLSVTVENFKTNRRKRYGVKESIVSDFSSAFNFEVESVFVPFLQD
jgi:Uma2 family endonuclease